MTNKGKGALEAKHARSERSLELRIAGASYRQIGRKLGVSERTAYYDVQDALSRLDKTVQAKAERLLELELAAVDRVLLGLSSEAFKGHPRSAEVWIKARERRAKLLGLDAPTKTQWTGADHIPATFTVTLTRPNLLALPATPETRPFTIDVGGNGHGNGDGGG